MTEVRCTVCGATVTLRSQFEVEGECPECDADPGCLEVLDPYDDPDIRTLRCAMCGWTVEAGVDVAWDEQEPQIYSIDDDCPVCHQAGFPGEALEAADDVRQLRDLPEHRVARAAAAKLRDQAGQEGVQVDVGKVAKFLGLTVRRGLFGHDGLLVGEVIEVPEGDPGVERFVIAHEIGHHVLRHQGDRRKIEPEANAFASELLIPPAALRHELATPKTINQLARRFEVSRQAVFYAVRAARLVARLSR